MFFHTDFFPIPPGTAANAPALRNTPEICIGTKSLHLGDALQISSLAQRLKSEFPHLRISTFARGFNPVVFQGNSAVTGIHRWPKKLFGDDALWGRGHNIQLKEQFLNLTASPHPKPEIFLSEAEETEAYDRVKFWLKGETRALVLIHPSGETQKGVWGGGWEELGRRLPRSRYCVVQVGVQGNTPVADIEHHWFLPRDPWQARKLFAVMKSARAFIGVDSGPMHVARAWNVPSLILLKQGNPEEIFLKRKNLPFYAPECIGHLALYSENEHWSLTGPAANPTGIQQTLTRIESFLEAQTR